jgi:hypothetical protein
MKRPERTQSVVVLLLVLGVATVLLVAGITSLNRFNPQGLLSTQTTGMPTDIDGSTFTPNVGTQKAIFHATRLATTRTPFPTQIPFPTGTFEGDEVKFSAKIKGLDALNAWSGYMDGNTVVIYAGSLLDDQEQGNWILSSFRIVFTLNSYLRLPGTAACAAWWMKITD